LERLPAARTPALGELTQPEPVAPPGTAQFVDREELSAWAVFDRELPALAFEDDPEHLDAPGRARSNEFRVVHEPVQPEPYRDLTVGLVLQVRQRDRATAEGGPHEHRGPHVGQVVDHPQPACGETRMVVVLAGIPAVEI